MTYQADQPFTHLADGVHPRQVDVSGKAVTRRVAVAEAHVLVPGAAGERLSSGDDRSPKGPIFVVARLAGIQATKHTHLLIPLCHALPVDQAEVVIEAVAGRPGLVRIESTVVATHRTGVEMEALTAASIAALTLHDMVKSAAPDTEILSVRLLSKTGGKSDYRAERRTP